MGNRPLRQGAALVAGLLVGAVLALVAVLLYLRLAADAEIAERVLRSIDLPASAFELEELQGDSLAVVSATDVLIRTEGGDTVVAAPSARLRIRLSSLAGDGAIVADEVRLQRPYVNLIQAPDGEFNLAQTLVVSAGGQEVGGGEGGRPIELRDVRLQNARIRLRTPFVPDSAAAPEPPGLRLVQSGGVLMRERWARDLDARLTRLRFGGGEGWRVEIGALTATLTDPQTRIANLAGSVRQSGDAALAFDVRELRTDASVLLASGTVRFAESGPVLDVQASAQPLAFEDLRWLLPRLPEEGEARGQVAISGSDGRYTVAATGMEVAVGDSRITGFVSATVGGEEEAVFGDTYLLLSPLRIETIRSFGLPLDLPYTGEIRGLITSAGGPLASGPELNVDLTTNFAPEAGNVATSTVFLHGPIGIGPQMEFRIEGVSLAFQPVYLAALRPLLDGEIEQLRGMARGNVMVSGTFADLRLADGAVTYQVGDAPVSSLTELAATIRRDPDLSFELTARAQPIALGTIAELFPTLPFRTARFSGPVSVAGSADEMEFELQLAGSPGTVIASGTIQPGTPLRFAVTGEVMAFNPEAVLTRPVPVEGPVSGSFAVNGTTEQFAFDVNLLQQGGSGEEDGSFALAGTFHAQGAAPPLLEAGGQVVNFNLGTVIGRPRLFPSRMSGRMDIAGGGTQPYRFDVDLQGDAGQFDLTGYFAAGDIPIYAAQGSVAGLDLRQVPGLQALPPTELRGTIDLEGQGTSLGTLAGRLRFDALGSTIGGTALERLQMDLAVEAGVLEVHSLSAALTGTQVTAEGRLGLTRPATGQPLQVRAVSSDLSRLAPLAGGVTGLPPRLTGSFLLQAMVTGSIQEPIVAGAFRGQQLRYEQYHARNLEIDADLRIANGFEQFAGMLEVNGSQLVTPSLTVDSVHLAAAGTDDSLTVQGIIRQEPGSDVRLAGSLELIERTPRGVLLDSLQLTSAGKVWDLQGPATVRWSAEEGLEVVDLVLADRADPLAYLRLNGTLPPEGVTDLRGEIRRLDLAFLQGMIPNSPDLSGMVNIDFILEGATTDPRLFAQGYGTAIEYEGVLVDSASFSANYVQQRMSGFAAAWQDSVEVASAEAEIPMVLSISDGTPSFELLRDQEMRATLHADSLPMALITAGTSMVTDGAGAVAGQLDLVGSVGDPTLSGFASIREGALTVPQLGRRLERITGHLILDEQRILVDTLVAWSGGRAEVNGSVLVADLERPELYLTATFNNFHAIDNDEIADLTMSGNVQIEGVMPQAVLTGSVRLQEGAIYIPSLSEQTPIDIADVGLGVAAVDTAVAAALGPGVLEQIRISGLEVAVEEGVWLESDEANVQIRGDLVVIRTGGTMQLYGNMEAIRGTYDLAIGPLLREFDVVAGSVRFLGTPDFNPEIDITAQHEVRAGTAGGAGSLAVLVHLTGTLQNPSIELTSNTQPPLPESELLSWLVFGQPSFRLQGTGALANQLVVQELVGGLLSRQLGDLGLPCEYFRLRGRPNILNVGGVDPLGSTSVECGVQVVQDVFVTVETGVLPSLSGGSGSLLGTLLGVSLDWRINDRMSARLAREPVQSAIGTLYLTQSELPYQFSADVRGTWEFGRPAEGNIPIPALDPLNAPQPQQLPPPEPEANTGSPLPANPPEEADEADRDDGEDDDDDEGDDQLEDEEQAE